MLLYSVMSLHLTNHRLVMTQKNNELIHYFTPDYFPQPYDFDLKGEWFEVSFRGFAANKIPLTEQ